jgi:antagonist of KipI
MKAFRVLRPGLLTTVQDLGRFGFASLGIPPSGAADPQSAILANRLARNADGAAVLEMTATGAQLEALGELRFAAAGAEMPLTRNGERLAFGTLHEAREGDRLDFGTASRGLRAYLAVEGGLDVAPVLGSLSTHLAAGLGGFQGRRLEAGDILDTRPPAPRAEPAQARPGEVRIPLSPVRLRVLPGPQADFFSPETVRRFSEAGFRVSPQSNRMGLRLEGETIPLANQAEILPEGVPVGAVQVPSGGDPIILMPEGPVTGGYPKIACVASVDLPLLGQIRPGDEVRFAFVTEEQALAALSRDGHS